MLEKIRFFGVCSAAACLGLVAGCGDDATSMPPDADIRGAIATYSRIVLASYQDSLDGAFALADAVEWLIEDPSEENLQAAREAWLAARESYLQTETYRFYEGPIDNEDTGPEGLINAWPLDEAYIDYVEDDASAGIINDLEATIDADSLIALNEAGGEKNIATGFHAIEFLLWGQDLSDDGPGDRPYTDFVDGGTAENQGNRRGYLRVVSGLLVENLSSLVDEWKEDEDNYRADFEAEEPEIALERILTGMIVLSGFETGGERLRTALQTGDQEDEHSCFSDNTHRDMVQDVRGIQNVWLGEYERTNGSTIGGFEGGVSVLSVVRSTDAALAERVTDRIAESLDLAEALEPPFDQEIKLGNDEGRARVQALIDSLNTQEDDLFDVFDAFGLTVEIPEA